MALQLGRFLLYDATGLLEVMWEKASLDMGRGAPPVDVVVDDVLVRDGSYVTFIQVRRLPPTRTRWSIAGLLSEGIARDFWTQWNLIEPTDRARCRLRLVTNAAVDALHGVLDAARQSRTAAELRHQAPRRTEQIIDALCRALEIELDDHVVAFLSAIEAEQIQDPQEELEHRLRTERSDAAALSQRLFALVQASKTPGPHSRSSHTRESLLRQLETDGVAALRTMRHGHVLITEGARGLLSFQVLPTAEGRIDQPQAWFHLLVQQSVRVVVSFNVVDTPLLGFLGDTLDTLSSHEPASSNVMLVLGDPTPDVRTWPNQGVYTKHGMGWTLAAEIPKEPDEALFMWLAYWAFSRGRLTDLADALDRVPSGLRPRVRELRRWHWPRQMSELDPVADASAQTLGSIRIPQFSPELVHSMLGAHVRSHALSLARDAFERRDMSAFAAALGAVSREQLSTRERIELRYLTLVGALWDGRDDEVRRLRAELDSDWHVRDRLELALYFARHERSEAARSLLDSETVTASHDEDAAECELFERTSALWIAAAERGWSDVGHASARREIAWILERASALRHQPPDAIGCALASFALRLANPAQARQALTLVHHETAQTTEYVHLKSLIDLRDVVLFQAEHPDRDIDQDRLLQLEGTVDAMRQAANLARDRGIRNHVLALTHNLGVALSEYARRRGGEERRRLFNEAALCWEESLTSGLDEPLIVENTALAYLSAGSPRDAVRVFDGARRDTLGPRMLSTFASALLLVGDLRRAIAVLSELLETRSATWQALTSVGAVLLTAGQPLWARRALESAIDRGGRHWTLTLLLGRAHRQSQEHREAERLFRRLIDERPFDPLAYVEHFECFTEGSVRLLSELNQELRRVFRSVDVDAAVLDHLEELVATARQVYDAAVTRGAGGDRSPDGVASSNFADALQRADRVEHVLTALMSRLDSRAEWEPRVLVEHVREVMVREYAEASTAPVAPGPAELLLPPLSWDKLDGTRSRIEEACSVPLTWESFRSGVLAELGEAQRAAIDNQAHRLHLAARRLGRQQEEPLGCYGAVRHTQQKGYQRRAVQRVVSDMHGRAILADHVGLGKTIEAGLILTEYRLRRLVRRCLVLVPSLTLREQWLDEMRDKFVDDPSLAQAYGQRDFRGWDQHVITIVTYSAAVRQAAAIKSHDWDMVIVDEAHHLHDRGTAIFKLVSRVRSRHLLLLTATPFQRSLDDLYSLARLVRPTLFVKLKRFRAMYGKHAQDDQEQVRTLQTLLSQIMIRNTIAGVGGELSTGRRLFRNPTIDLTSDERAFYSEAIAFVITASKTQERLPLTYFLLAREATSCPTAALGTIEHILERSPDAERVALESLRRLAARIAITTKMAAVREIVANTAPRKVLVFVEFRASALALERHLSAVVLHGGMTAAERTAAIQRVDRDPAQRLLVVTPGMVEGLNFQFCSVLVNFDLPWNPARIEQRIGRIQRIGQRHEHLEIFSLASVRTIEEEIRNGLVQKVRLFERLLGPLDLVLGPSDNWSGLQARLIEIIKDAATEDELRASIGRLFEEEITPIVAKVQAGNLEDVSALLRKLPRRQP